MVKASEKLKFFIGKLSLWSCRLQGGNLANFPFLDEIIVKGGTSLQEMCSWKLSHIWNLSVHHLTITFLLVNVMESWM